MVTGINQNTGVQDPVLFGSDQFLVFEKQDSQIPLVFDSQVGDRASLSLPSQPV